VSTNDVTPHSRLCLPTVTESLNVSGAQPPCIHSQKSAALQDPPGSIMGATPTPVAWSNIVGQALDLHNDANESVSATALATSGEKCVSEQ
jgi:hypothetical protein